MNAVCPEPALFDVVLPSRSRRATLTLFASEKGAELSWAKFIQHRFEKAESFEKQFGLTVQLTDTITQLIRLAQSIDPECALSIKRLRGFLFPDFNLVVKSKQYTLELAKRFIGGASRNSPFNYEIFMDVYSDFSEYVELFLKACQRRTKGAILFSDR